MTYIATLFYVKWGTEPVIDMNTCLICQKLMQKNGVIDLNRTGSPQKNVLVLEQISLDPQVKAQECTEDNFLRLYTTVIQYGISAYHITLDLGHMLYLLVPVICWYLFCFLQNGTGWKSKATKNKFKHLQVANPVAEPA